MPEPVINLCDERGALIPEECPVCCGPIVGAVLAKRVKLAASAKWAERFGVEVPGDAEVIYQEWRCQADKKHISSGRPVPRSSWVADVTKTTPAATAPTSVLEGR